MAEVSDEAMEESERQIQVRSLTGESTTISISPKKTIQELKLLLRQTFSPASNSPNFHLFFKGVKLRLHSRITSYSTESGEFMVVVPYTKKDRQHTQQYDEAASHLKGPTECSTSKAADLAWSDMIQDLSFLRNISSKGTPSNVESKGMNSADSNEVTKSLPVNKSSKTKLKRRLNCDKQEGHIDELIISILESSENTQLDQRNCKRLMQVFESVNCLSNPHSDKCIFKEAYLQGTDMHPYANKNDLCICPCWLKKIMKAFYFLNIYSAYLQMQWEKVTSICLLEALDQLRKFGFEVGIADLEHLSVLCPKVVRFVDDEIGVANLHDALVVINSSGDQRHEVESISRTARKCSSTSKIVNSMKKREGSFKKNLCGAVKLLVHKTGNEMAKFVSLEDLLLFAKEVGNTAREDEVKRPRKTWSAASSAHSYPARCHETNPLLPMEMIEHLRNGIGACGQTMLLFNTYMECCAEC